jgi:hypothetical protein
MDPLKIVSNTNLMFRSGEYLYSKEEGLALLVSRGVFGRTLTPTKMEKKQQGFFKRLFWKEKQPTTGKKED